MGDDHVPIMENMLGIVGGPNQPTSTGQVEYV